MAPPKLPSSGGDLTFNQDGKLPKRKEKRITSVKALSTGTVKKADFGVPGLCLLYQNRAFSTISSTPKSYFVI
jgi:hypothetical protein